MQTTNKTSTQTEQCDLGVLIAQLNRLSVAADTPDALRAVLSQASEMIGSLQAQVQRSLPLHAGAELQVVLSEKSGFAREDASSPDVIGVYTDPAVARVVKMCLNGTGTKKVVVDFVPPGVWGIAKELSLRLPLGMVSPGQ